MWNTTADRQFLRVWSVVGVAISEKNHSVFVNVLNFVNYSVVCLIFSNYVVSIALPERFQQLYKLGGGGVQQHENCVDLCTSLCSRWVRG
jgi:hypothetical protein